MPSSGRNAIPTIDKKKVDQRKLVRQIQEEAREQLLPTLKDKMQQTTDLIVSTLNDKGKDNVSNIQIMSLIAKGSLLETALGNYMSYTNQELKEAFNCYLEMIYKINEIKPFPPTVESFANFIGVSSTVYNNWLVDPDRKDVMEFIHSYLTGVLATGSITGELKEISSIYLQKVMGKVEQSTPIVVEHKKMEDIDEIKKKIEFFKKDNVIDADWEEKNEEKNQK